MTVTTNPDVTGVSITSHFPQILSQGGPPIGIAPTGTMGANGAVTLGTALGATYSGGIWLYFPAGAVFAASAAGFYYVVMTNTTAGTVYTNTHTPGTNSSAFPSSGTAVSDAGPGAYTGVTSEITAVSVTVPGGLMGKNGRLEQGVRTTFSNSAGTKTHKPKLDGTGCGSTAATTTNASHGFVGSLQNQGAQNLQGFVNTISDTGGSTSIVITLIAIDTSVNTTWTFTMQLNTATDYFILNRHSLVCHPS